jgi:CDP-diacylglycerol pyrophosphatase
MDTATRCAQQLERHHHCRQPEARHRRQDEMTSTQQQITRAWVQLPGILAEQLLAAITAANLNWKGTPQDTLYSVRYAVE